MDKIVKSNLLICGSKIIRKELRDTPEHVRIGRNKLRSAMINSYDQLVSSKRNYGTNSILEKIAKEYYTEYRGNCSWKEIMNDFLIVATASMHGIDIVVSNDEKTMAGKEAIKAYEIVNKKFELFEPRFIKFCELERMI